MLVYKVINPGCVNALAVFIFLSASWLYAHLMYRRSHSVKKILFRRDMVVWYMSSFWFSLIYGKLSTILLPDTHLLVWFCLIGCKLSTSLEENENRICYQASYQSLKDDWFIDPALDKKRIQDWTFSGSFFAVFC